MKVALIKSPNIGSQVRGGGSYADHLMAALSLLVNVSLVEFSLLPRAYQNFDIVHFSYFDEYFFTLPPFLPKNSVISILDCTKLKFSDRFPMGLRAKIAWPWQKMLASKAENIITISQSAKTDIENFFDVSASKITVTYLAADVAFKPLNLKKENFVLYVGGANWNKNVITLVKSCQKAKMPLVIVGEEFTQKPNKNIETEPLKKILKQVQDDQNIKILGYVAKDELVRLYNQAKVYVQPSIYEGFGLPVLEAMACNCPVICGKNSSLVEIAGDAATYADVTNLADLAEKIAHVQPTGKELSQVAKFSWQKTAMETYQVYENINNRSRI